MHHHNLTRFRNYQLRVVRITYAYSHNQIICRCLIKGLPINDNYYIAVVNYSDLQGYKGFKDYEDFMEWMAEVKHQPELLEDLTTYINLKESRVLDYGLELENCKKLAQEIIKTA